jgi:peptidyl-prolyl cis-trans isomerase C
MYKAYRIGLVAILLGLPALQAQERLTTPPTPATVAATVNGQDIPEVAVQRALRAVPPEKQADARVEIVGFLIDNALLEQHLAPQVPVSPQEVDNRLQELRTQLTKQKLEYAKVLKDMMLTEEELASHVRAEIRWDKYVENRVTDKALHDLFDQNRDLFDGTVVRARHLLLTPNPQDAKAVEQARQELLTIKKDIEYQCAKGLGKLPLNVDNLAREKERGKLIEEAFADYARKKSMCPSKEEGGDVNYFPRFGGMVEPFAQAAFALKPYQMSDVVQTQFGLHLILMTDRKAGKPDVKFEEVKDDIKEVFAFRLREGLSKELRQKAKIVMK